MSSLDALSSFLAIESHSSRVHWISYFLLRPGAFDPPFDVPFPDLRAGEAPSAWLSDQYRRAAGHDGLQDRIRQPVVELITTEGRHAAANERGQLLGLLLQVAGECGFVETAAVLKGWVRASLYGEETYSLAGSEVALRRTVWSILIAWNQTADLETYLEADMVAPRADSVALCFAELSRIAPERAISQLPAVLRLARPYRNEILRDFFARLGPSDLLNPRFEKAWAKCATAVEWDFAAAPVRDLLIDLLAERGIQYFHEGGHVTISYEKSYEAYTLHITDDSAVIQHFDKSLEDESNKYN